jgi:hypothetical protein
MALIDAYKKKMGIEMDAGIKEKADKVGGAVRYVFAKKPTRYKGATSRSGVSFNCKSGFLFVLLRLY